ncbi:type II toxin-antitoxin system RelE/ParE family toxin [Desulfomonile tiedjei]|uniref:Phage derived protein Gp49-like (DUF891) n=1 Tax=Desulfomonile tiedjei (strain ATCC 49306 / DSM 6799 / DCB-1) TaxID=706587 RepID=I4C7D3_DESTA|nr:type II toxin-antitoxin system RelE/ParE family toxin [Desulfomonile tiedjei]AFM25474.1 Phage derived protein Gp49-like (DUF891) [Desulfomonile tiedjei DSM 6799]
MPSIEVVYYQNDNNDVPMKDWLESLSRQPKHRAKCIEWIGLLRDNGRDLRRPIADYLRDGVYELRPRIQKIRYRMLYFFHLKKRAVITHGITKQTDKVPPIAVMMKKTYEKAPDEHSYREIDHE